MEQITSPQNEYIKQLSKLKSAPARKKAGQFIIEGKKLCHEALRSNQRILKCLFTNAEKENPLLEELAENQKIYIDDRVAKKITDMDTCPGIFMVIEIPKPPKTAQPNFILALDHLSDPSNLGAVLRSAEAFGAKLVYLSKGSVDLFSPKVLRGAMGSAFRVPVIIDDLPALLSARKEEGYRILGAGLNRAFKQLPEITFDAPTVVVIGNEANGITEEIMDLCDQGLFIPMQGENESLNAAVAASIILWEQSKWN